MGSRQLHHDSHRNWMVRAVLESKKESIYFKEKTADIAVSNDHLLDSETVTVFMVDCLCFRGRVGGKCLVYYRHCFREQFGFTMDGVHWYHRIPNVVTILQLKCSVVISNALCFAVNIDGEHQRIVSLIRDQHEFRHERR